MQYVTETKGAYVVLDPHNYARYGGALVGSAGVLNEVHQYLDGASSGTETSCTSNTIGSERLAAFTAWLMANNRRAYLGELGGGRNSACYQAVDDILDHLDAHRDVWIGFAVWAAGPWWGDYQFSIEPPGGGGHAPLMPYLLPHL